MKCRKPEMRLSSVPEASFFAGRLARTASQLRRQYQFKWFCANFIPNRQHAYDNLGKNAYLAFSGWRACPQFRGRVFEIESFAEYGQDREGAASVALFK